MDEQQGGIMGWVQNHLILVSVVVIGLVLGLLFIKKPTTGTSTSASTTPQADLSGLQRDANGNPIVYRDVADTFVNISKVITDSYNTATSTTTSQVNSNNTMPVPSAPSPAPQTPADPVEHPIEAFVRSRFNSPLTQHYDQGQPAGIPIRSTPGGPIIGYAPYGSELELKNSNSTSGPSNLSKTTGSTQWLQTSKGYISAYDITGTINQ